MKTKTQLTSIVFLVISCMYSFGQGGLGGNNRPIGGWPLGWTAGNPGPLEIRNDFTSSINFLTAGTQKATITSGGYVGIGVAAPATSMLEISGLTALNGNVFQTNCHNVATYWRQFRNFGAQEFHIASNSADVLLNSVSAGIDMKFLTQNTQRMVIENTGHVGIGTIAPTAMLYVRGDPNISAEIFRSQSTLNTNALLQLNNDETMLTNSANLGIVYRFTHTDPTLTPTGVAGAFHAYSELDATHLECGRFHSFNQNQVQG